MALAVFTYPAADAVTRHLGTEHLALGVTQTRPMVCALAMTPLALVASRAHAPLVPLANADKRDRQEPPAKC